MAENLKLNMNRIFKCDSKTLFNAIAEGMLFKYTGALMDKLEMDFKVGGLLRIEWKGHGAITGVFKDIKPFERIAFTWKLLSKELNQEIETLVTVDIKEKYGKTILSLRHEGFTNFKQVEEHNFGWDDALQDLRKSFRALFAELEQNTTGLDLYFKLKKIIKAPRKKVFNAVFAHDEIAKYFSVEASASLVEGTAVIWQFKNYKPLTLHVHKIVTDEMIKFQWGKSHVCFSFQDLSEGRTEVVIEATGWTADQAGLDDSYSECDGWTEFLILLKRHVEG